MLCATAVGVLCADRRGPRGARAAAEASARTPTSHRGPLQVDVVRASFPAKQHLAKPERFVIAVRNTGDRGRCRTSPSRSDSFCLALRAGRAGRPRAARCGSSTSSPSARRHRLHQHVGARGAWPRARRGCFVRRVTAVKAGTPTRSGGRSRPGSTARQAKATLAGKSRPGKGSVTVDVSADWPAQAHVILEIGQGRPRRRASPGPPARRAPATAARLRRPIRWIVRAANPTVQRPRRAGQSASLPIDPRLPEGSSCASASMPGVPGSSPSVPSCCW